MWLLPGCALLLLAADPAWKTKSIRDWTEEDAKQILTDSPWTLSVRSAVMPLESESARREGGNMGQPQGVGYKGVDNTTDAQKLAKVMSGNFAVAPPIGPVVVRVRWESALPVRAAELKAHEVEPPTLEGDGYQIAVYGLPGTYFKGGPKTLGGSRISSCTCAFSWQLANSDIEKTKPNVGGIQASIQLFHCEKGMKVI
jgi:hypothetical protein